MDTLVDMYMNLYTHTHTHNHKQVIHTDPLHVRIHLQNKGDIIFKAPSEQEAKLWLDGVRELLANAS